MNILKIGKVKYHFTSETIRDNFKRDRETYRKTLEESLTNRFKIHVKVSQEFADLVLYHRYSTKLFLVEFGGKTYSNMQDIFSEVGVQNI